MNVDIEKIKDFFFRSSILRWTGKLEKQPIPELPGGWKYYHDEDNLHYTHLQFRGDVSGLGIILIHQDYTPVWRMVADGAYGKEARGFLEIAFLEAYNKKQFFGGRGPFNFFHHDFPGLEYINQVDVGKFENFSGVEWIRKDKKSIGDHHYRGGIL
jgi:hypothetical protein